MIKLTINACTRLNHITHKTRHIIHGMITEPHQFLFMLCPDMTHAKAAIRASMIPHAQKYIPGRYYIPS
ncbi:hypothetical protein AKI40_pA019 (plasmid) [Enterobacter sp. FY-07]|nr:hypothetical protein AKI40_pA019 [Enterobacter sp. FY-07]